MEDGAGRAEFEALLAARPDALAHARSDPDRPRFHFLPEPGWMNDPVPFFARGRYHIFFQHHPGRPYWGDIHWGHAQSADLVRWAPEPEALEPSPGGPDAGGCWTGCVVADGGRHHALYTGVEPQVQCLAESADLTVWSKHERGPVIGRDQRPAGLGETFRDPCVWREGDLWLMALGADLPDGSGHPLLYRSEDLRRWTYLHPLCAGGPAPRDECPDLFALGGRHVLLSSRGQTAWAIGRRQGLRFMPEAAGVCDAGALYAVKTLEDAAGRRLAWGWVRETRPVAEQVRAGWSGALSLPRVLSVLPDGTLGAAPPVELAALRGPATDLPPPDLSGTSPDTPARLEVPPGGCFELEASFAWAEDGEAGILLPGAPPVRWGAREQGPSAVSVFVDRSVVEVFLGGRGTRTCRAYGTWNAGWIGLFGRGSAVTGLRAWPLAAP